MKLSELEFGTVVYYKGIRVVVLQLEATDKGVRIAYTNGDHEWVSAKSLNETPYAFGDKIIYKHNMGTADALFISVKDAEAGTMRICRRSDGLMDLADIDEIKPTDWA